jgi:hypothetical protein
VPRHLFPTQRGDGIDAGGAAGRYGAGRRGGRQEQRENCAWKFSVSGMKVMRARGSICCTMETMRSTTAGEALAIRSCGTELPALEK